MKLIYCLLLALCAYSMASAQAKQHPVSGTQVPNVRFANVLNYAATLSDLYQFKNKILIIDFWTTFCSACIREIPMLDSIQKKHPNELSVILVSSSKADTKDKASKILKRISDSHGSKVILPVILGDTIINKFFPHTFVPHFAILDSNMQVLAVTDVDDLTPQNIESLIRTGKVYFKIENGIQDFNGEKLMFNDQNTLFPEIMFQSTVSTYSKNAPSSTYIDKDSSGNVTRVLLTNQPILDLLKRAFGYFGYPEIIVWPPGLEDSLSPRGKPKEWIRSNSYTYQLICPPLKYDSAMSILRQDVKRIFGYTAQVKSELFKYYLLKTDTIFDNALKSAIKSDNSCENNGEDISEVIRYLRIKFDCVIVDESDHNLKVLIDLSVFENKNFNEVKQILASYGLNLDEGKKTRSRLFIYHSQN
ncbi:TlpA family protein disulfide reductase [Ferruginibacter sp.]|nr:TlpA family protein disulfide reductase [Ferruginibacter sp.]